MDQKWLDLAVDIAQDTKGTSFQNDVIIADILQLLSDQKPEYSGFEFKRNDTFALVLKADTSKNKKPIELKIREVNRINDIQSEYHIRSYYNNNQKIAQVRSSFYLTRIIKQNTTKAYLVEEMDLSDGNLGQYLLEFKRKKQPIDKDIKMQISIQMLDILHCLHQKNIVHRNITPDNFLILNKDSPQPIIQLCDFSFSVPFNIGLEQPSPKNYNFNKESKLFLLPQELLGCRSDLKPPTAKEALINFRKQSPNLKKVQLSSIIFLDNFTDKQSSPLQSSALSMNRKEIFHSDDDHEIQVKIKNLIPKSIEGQNNIFESILYKLISEGEFKIEKFVGMGKTIVYEVYNIKEKRNYTTVLKISLCNDKKVRANKLAEFGLLQICQMPNIISIYGYQFLKDNKENTFLIEEQEKCQETLSSFLRNNPKIIFSDEQKRIIFLQILKSVDYLHDNNFFHGNITLDNILVSQARGSDYQFKLTDFDQSAQSEDDWIEKKKKTESTKCELLPPYNCLIRENKKGTYLYSPPEKKQQQSLTTKLTDTYAVGVCLFIINNNQILTEDDAWGCNGDFSQFHKQIKDSKYFHLIGDMIKDSPFERKSIKNAIFELRENIPNNSVVRKLPFDIQSTDQILNLGKNFRFVDFPKSLPEVFRQLPNLLKLSLNLQSKNLNDTDAILILNSLIKLPNLVILDLDYGHNNLSLIGAEAISIGLIKLNNLSSLNLDLGHNKLNTAGSQFIANALNKKTNLSSLTLNLESNNIGDNGAQSLSKALQTLNCLFSLSVNLCSNSLSVAGIESFQELLGILNKLSKNNLNFSQNKISFTITGQQEKDFKGISSCSSIDKEDCQSNQSDLGTELVDKIISRAESNSSSSSLENCLSNQTPTSTQFFEKRFQKQHYNLLSLNFNFSYNKLTDKDIGSLSEAIKLLENLENLFLNLENNELSRDGINLLLNALTKLHLSSLHLNLMNNTITTESGQQSPIKVLGQLSYLISLNLNCGNCNLSVIDIYFLSFSLKKLPNLSSITLDLTNIQINKSQYKYFLNSLKNRINLQNLNLIFRPNDLGKDDIQLLCNTFSSLKNLSSLSLTIRDDKILNTHAKYLKETLETLDNIANLNLDIGENNIMDSRVTSLKLRGKLRNINQFNNDFSAGVECFSYLPLALDN